MKKLLCTLMALMLITACAACAETPVPVETAQPTETIEPAHESITLGFEDGFSIELPAGWLYYPVTQDMAGQGVLYCLSDASAEHWLYIQSWNSDCSDTADLKVLIDRAASQDAGIYTFQGTDFVIYDLPAGDVSCCATLLNGGILNFMFTPQSDSEFMALATQITSSFAVLEP